MAPRYDEESLRHHDLAMEEDCKSRMRGLLGKVERRAKHELESLVEGLEGRVEDDLLVMARERKANVLDYISRLRKEIAV